MNVANLEMAVPNAQRILQLCALVKSVMTCRITAVAQKTVPMLIHANPDNVKLNMMKLIRLTLVLILVSNFGNETAEFSPIFKQYHLNSIF